MIKTENLFVIVVVLFCFVVAAFHCYKLTSCFLLLGLIDHGGLVL